MTFIAYSTDYDDHAEIVTDTLAYTARSEELTHTTKSHALPHLDAVVIPHGDGDFANPVVTHMLLEANHAGSFDRFATAAPEWLTHLWNRLRVRLDRELEASQVHLLGYSEDRAEFVAWRYTFCEDFAQVEAPGLNVYPTPFTMRPPAPERDILRAALAGDPGGERFLARWDAQPVPETPADVAGWVDLAQTVREERALQPFLRTPVGGKVFHTVLRRGRVITRHIYTYNDSGEEFAQLVSGTNHPVGLAGACPCDSGRRFGECCAAGVPRISAN